MPLPAGGATPWPPKDYTPILDQYATWGAWWRGDVDALAAIYGGGQQADTTGFFASQGGGWRATAQRAVGWLARRWFWGTSAAAARSRTRLHAPLAGDIAETAAALLFGEPLSVTAADDATTARLGEVLDDGAYATLLEAAEVCAAIGGVYLRVVWDPAVRDRPWFTAIAPSVAVPEWRWGSLAAVTFGREVGRKGQTVWRHLERHEPGKILHGLFEGNADELGRPVPLTDHPETATLANDQLVNGNEIATGTDRLTVVYVPNIRPNRVWQHLPAGAHLGRPDIAGAEPLLDALDLTWSSWVRDVDLGKARLVVPSEYLRSLGPGQGATVDLDTEVYEGINAMTDESGNGGVQITQVQFAIRVAEHQSTVDAIKHAVIDSAGYSGQTFGMDDGAALTATEVAARERRSFITRDRKIRYWRPALADLLEVLLEVDAAIFASGVVPQRPDVEFSAAVSEDPEALARELELLHRAEAISIEQRVRRLHPDWDDPRVMKEVKRIREDASAGMPDPTESLGGFAGNGGQDPGRE